MPLRLQSEPQNLTSMRNIEVTDRQNELNGLVMFLVGANVITIPREQKLLMAPVEAPKSRLNSMNFDPQLEPRYLGQFEDIQMRLSQSEEEMATSLKEMYLSQFEHGYVFEGGCLFDEKTYLDVALLTKNGKIEEENTAMIKIIKMLGEGQNMIVNISGENNDLGYPDNMVDFWLMGSDGKVRILRYKVEGDARWLKDFYKTIGGELVDPSVSEILADPVGVTNHKFAEVLNMLVISKETTKIKDKQIEDVTHELTAYFYKEFGYAIFEDPNLILRLYLAIGNEIKKNSKNGELTKTAISQIQVNIYKFGQMEIKNVAGHGCGGTAQEGQFGSGQGWILVVVDGQMTSYFGSTEGMSHCEKCGCYHSGPSCPYCDLHYKANC